jgi:branched-chain amino acid transport system permease protein
MSPDLLFFCAINVMLAWSVYAVMTTGVLSFAAAAFMAIGCYTAGLLTVKAGWPLIPALLAGAAVSAIASLPIGIPTLRLRGVHFILATIGVTISMQVVFENVELVGGSTGFGGMTGATPLHAVIVVIILAAILTFISFSPLQRILDAVREDSRVADSLGVNSVYVRVAAFAAGAAIAGYAGGLYGHYLVFVRPDSFGIQVAIFSTFYVIMGGSRNPWGPAVGAIILTLLPEYFTVLREWRPTVFGLAIILIILLRPSGVLPLRLPTARLGAWRRA